MGNDKVIASKHKLVHWQEHRLNHGSINRVLLPKSLIPSSNL